MEIEELLEIMIKDYSQYSKHMVKNRIEINPEVPAWDDENIAFYSGRLGQIEQYAELLADSMNGKIERSVSTETYGDMENGATIRYRILVFVSKEEIEMRRKEEIELRRKCGQD